MRDTGFRSELSYGPPNEDDLVTNGIEFRLCASLTEAADVCFLWRQRMLTLYSFIVNDYVKI